MRDILLLLGLALAGLGFVISVVNLILDWRSRHDKHK